jgi:hypothetical protein
MALPTNAFASYESKGNREGLSDLISRIDPTDTPFQANAGRESTDTILAEWQTQSLAAANGANAVLEGDTPATITAVTPTVRIGNYHQISIATASVTRTQNRIKKAGRKNEMDYQVILKGMELKRDMETIFLQNQAAVAGADATIRKLGSMCAYLKTNVDFGATGVNPVWTNIPTGSRTNGTARPLTLTIAKNVVKLMFDNGAKVEGAMVMVGSGNKALFSTFTGIATQTYYVTKAQKSALIGGLDVWVTDFGTVEVAPNRFQRTLDAWFLDFSHIRIGVLEPLMSFDLAKVGDSTQKEILTEYTLIVDNEKGQGLATDLS